ncbi:MAG TPA: NTP transferase domain-containing protein [Acidobacteriota bacterium]|nr:NTP transferase domain-containing protein [Acidobacteriota bacterium]HQM64942.1 NTP transferase domain-containing protein [Acidobacteriota bacterium]
MSHVKHAIISAAGLGSRLGLDMPKCLLQINHKPIIEYQLELLRTVEDVRVVVGFLEDQVIDTIKRLRRDVVFIRNPLYRTTSTSYSLHLATKDLQDSFLIIDGDLLINPKSFETFLQRCNGQASIIGITRAKTEDAVFVEVQNQQIVRFHRRPQTDYEWCGVAFLKDLPINKDLIYIYEELEKRCPLDCHEIECYEIDTPADYQQAIQFFDHFDRLDVR